MRFLNQASQILGKKPFKKIFILICLLILIPILRSVPFEGYGIAKNQNNRILRIGTSGRVRSANIFLDSYMSVFAQLSNPPLMKMTPDGRIVGQIAKDIHISSDYMRWEFHIQEDLYWSDGEPVTPEDVKFTIEYIRDRSPVAGWMKDTIDTVFISDEKAVILQLKRPYTRLDVEMATHRLLPKHIWQSIDTPMQYTNPGENVGCGPFFIQKIDLNRGVILFAQNPFWKGPKPKIDAIEVHIYQNIDVLSLALDKGEIDVFYNYASSYPYQNLKKIRANSRFDFIEKLSTGLIFLGLNLGKAPMSDLRFREALSFAIDYREIIKLDSLGYGKIPNRGFLPPTIEHYKDTTPLEYNPEKAKQILDDSGYGDHNGDGIREGHDGKNLALTLLVRPVHARLAELIQDYLRSVGVKTTTKSVDSSTWINLKDRYRYDLTIARTTPWGMIMHAGWATGYFDSRRTGEGVLHNIDDPKFFKLCDDLLSTRNKEKLRDFAFQVQDYYNGQLPAIPLYWNVFVTPFHTKFQGWLTNPLYGIFNIDNFLNIEPAQK
jgi:peptide/nickel transport system substrate-binding protein